MSKHTKKKSFGFLTKDTAEFVVAHGDWNLRRGRGPSATYDGVKNPREAYKAAQTYMNSYDVRARRSLGISSARDGHDVLHTVTDYNSSAGGRDRVALTISIPFTSPQRAFEMVRREVLTSLRHDRANVNVMYLPALDKKGMTVTGDPAFSWGIAPDNAERMLERINQVVAKPKGNRPTFG